MKTDFLHLTQKHKEKETDFLARTVHNTKKLRIEETKQYKTKITKLCKNQHLKISK